MVTSAKTGDDETVLIGDGSGSQPGTQADFIVPNQIRLEAATPDNAGGVNGPETVTAPGGSPAEKLADRRVLR